MTSMNMVNTSSSMTRNFIVGSDKGYPTNTKLYNWSTIRFLKLRNVKLHFLDITILIVLLYKINFVAEKYKGP